MATSEPTVLLSMSLHSLLRLVSFRDLNPSLVSFPLGYRAYPNTPTPVFYGNKRFGVWQNSWVFRPLAFQSVTLPSYLPLTRLYSDTFREEPAITSFVRLFTPNPSSPEGFVTHHRYGPPFYFRRTSPYPGLAQLVSGLNPVTASAFTLCSRL